ncbi:MAG: carboxylesterase family protein [Erysipelotrichaceae bacterium]|nr:carboxylesterase family protein [Erysipelotrichaceae bacterium]
MRYRYSLKHCQAERTTLDGIPVLILRPREKAIRTAVMWIHGGGYFLGMKEMVFISRAMDMVSKYGVTVISPGYRL